MAMKLPSGKKSDLPEYLSPEMHPALRKQMGYTEGDCIHYKEDDN